MRREGKGAETAFEAQGPSAASDPTACPQVPQARYRDSIAGPPVRPSSARAQDLPRLDFVPTFLVSLVAAILLIGSPEAYCRLCFVSYSIFDLLPASHWARAQDLLYRLVEMPMPSVPSHGDVPGNPLNTRARKVLGGPWSRRGSLTFQSHEVRSDRTTGSGHGNGGSMVLSGRPPIFP